MTSRYSLSAMIKADFADGFDDESQDDEAEINQLTEEFDLSDPDRTKIMSSSTETLVEVLQKRCDGQLSWLEENYPEVFREQLHTVKDTQERVYWHYGYAIALCDVLNLLGYGVDSPNN